VPQLRAPARRPTRGRAAPLGSLVGKSDTVEGTGEMAAAPRTAEPARPPVRVAVTRVAVVVCVVIAVAAAQRWYGNRHNYFDLKIYFHAIRWWASGHQLYDYIQLDRIQTSLGFTYPPFAAVLMYPMAWLPLGLVIVATWVGSAVCVLVTTAWLIRPLVARHGWSFWYAMCLTIPLISTLEPIRENFAFGQINMYLAVLILGDLLFLTPRGSRWGGVGVGLAAAIKLTPAIFIGYLLVTRRFRAAATAAATAVGATLLAAALAPSESWRYWTSTLWQTDRIGHLYLVQNQSMMGTLSRLARPDSARTLPWVALVAVITGYGLWRAARASGAGDELVGITLTGLVGSLISPVSWQHHLYWFVPALIVLLDVVATRGAPYRAWYAAVGVVVWTTVTMSLISFFDWRYLPASLVDTPEGFLVLNSYVLLMLLLLVVLPIRQRTPATDAPVEMAASRG
jgi:alpha-1,2-mannosyltransferase